MDKIKSLIREVFSLERITVCLGVTLMPTGALLSGVLLVASLANISFVKAIMITVGVLVSTCLAIFLFGVVLSIIYTTYSRIYNHYRYKDEDLYEDIDYEDEDTDE